MFGLMIDIGPKFYAVPSPTPYMTLGQGHGLRIFMLKFLGPHYFQTIWYIWFIFGMMVDIGWKFHAVPFPPATYLKVKVTDLEFLC